MAYSLHSSLTPSLFPPLSLKPNPNPNPNPNQTVEKKSYNPVHCGPRGNRGPIFKGRILSIEAIQAIQSLKRAHRSNPTSNLPPISRLLKSDLLATLRELLRQDQCTLALHVLSTLRSEYPPVDLNLYADLVNALARNSLMDDIDRLIGGIEVIDGGDDDKGLVRLIKAVIGAGRRESTVRIYGLLRESGWGSTSWNADEYVVKVLGKGLRRLGEKGLADEVQRELGGVLRGNLENEKLSVQRIL